MLDADGFLHAYADAGISERLPSAELLWLIEPLVSQSRLYLEAKAKAKACDELVGAAVQLASACAERDALRAELRSKDAELAELNSRLDLVRDQRDTETSTKNDRVASLDTERRDWQTRALKVESELAEVRAELDAAQSSKRHWEENAAQRRHEARELQNELQAAKAEAARWHGGVAQLREYFMAMVNSVEHPDKGVAAAFRNAYRHAADICQSTLDDLAKPPTPPPATAGPAKCVGCGLVYGHGYPQEPSVVAREGGEARCNTCERKHNQNSPGRAQAGADQNAVPAEPVTNGNASAAQGSAGDGVEVHRDHPDGCKCAWCFDFSTEDRDVLTRAELVAALREFSVEFGNDTPVIGDGLGWLADRIERGGDK